MPISYKEKPNPQTGDTSIGIDISKHPTKDQLDKLRLLAEKNVWLWLFVGYFEAGKQEAS